MLIIYIVTNIAECLEVTYINYFLLKDTTFVDLV